MTEKNFLAFLDSPRRSTWILSLLAGLVFVSVASPDIVTLKDGTTLRCQVIDKSEATTAGNHYLEVHIGQSVIWLNKNAVERIEKSSAPAASTPEVEELVNRLMKEGILVPTVPEKAAPAPAAEDKSEPSREQDISIRAKEIRGWAYSYENEKAVEDGKRTPIAPGDAIPMGSILKVSPNTRMTLDVPKVGDIGLEAGTSIRFDKMVKNRSLRSYTMAIRIDAGRCWLNVRSDERLILSINSIGCVPQNALFFVETTGKAGALNVTYLKGENDLKFSRNRSSEAPYILNQGQVLRVDPGTNTLPVEDSPQAIALQQRIDSWNNWKPETLAFTLEGVLPPLKTFPSFRALPALYPYKIPIDQSLLAPPETRSLGEILAIYRQALEKYRLDTGRYPTFDQGLDALTKSFNAAGWKGPYIDLNLPRRDVWGKPFVYDIYTDKGKQYPDVRSNGPNGKDDKGIGDDIR